MNAMVYLGICAAMVGLLVSAYIYRKKEKQKPLVCPRTAKCDDVVASKYGTLAGVSNALLGTLFYALMIVQFGAFATGIVFVFQLPLLIICALAGFLFSLYLIVIELFVLRMWCLWCMVSSAAATAVFFSSLFL